MLHLLEQTRTKALIPQFNLKTHSSTSTQYHVSSFHNTTTNNETSNYWQRVAARKLILQNECEAFGKLYMLFGKINAMLCT